tara:strand:+ start:272 stop:511 length:240 start_codon:yes stop_codon:yes gene_type:complete
VKAEKIFNYSKHPFELQSFSFIMETESKEIARKTIFLYIGIRPVVLAISTSTDYSITIELKVWKLSLAFNLKLWSQNER